MARSLPKQGFDETSRFRIPNEGSSMVCINGTPSTASASLD
jgi:hypothetical protein